MRQKLAWNKNYTCDYTYGTVLVLTGECSSLGFVEWVVGSARAVHFPGRRGKDEVPKDVRRRDSRGGAEI